MTLDHAAHRVLVTGSAGFTGRYLVPVLCDAGYEVHGLTASSGAAGPRLYHVDLLDRSKLCAVVEQVDPTHVVHLAAIAFVAHGDAEQIYRTNIVGTRNLLQALCDAQAARGRIRRVLIASSANVYGNTDVDPITEDVPPRPANDYAVSKLASEYVAALSTPDLPLTIVRPFNYTGVGQSALFLVPKIVIAFRSGATELELGNLDVERDFSDVRDVVEIYRRLLESARGGLFNVCSGQVYSLRNVLDLVAQVAGRSLEVKVNPAFVRTSDVRRLRGSNARLMAALGGDYRPRQLRDTLKWMFEGSDVFLRSY